MSPTLQFDDEASRRIETIYSTPDVIAQRQAVREALAVRPGERVLDIGAGPGFLAAEMAASAAPNGMVIGTDVSESMLAIAAARLGSAEDVELRFEHADACVLPYVVPGRQGLTEADVAAWKDELNDLSESGDYFFSLNRYLFRAVKR